MLCYKIKFGCKQTASLQQKKKKEKKKVVFDVADSEPIFLHDTPRHGDIPQYQVWLQIVERFRRYRPDKIGHMDRRTDGRTDGRSDSNTLIYSPVLIPEGRGLTLSEALGTAEVFLQLSKRSFFSLFFFLSLSPAQFPFALMALAKTGRRSI